MAGQSFRDVIAGRALFEGLDPEYLDFLAAAASERHLNRGAVLFREDGRADRFYLILKGLVTIEVPAISGPDLEVQSLGPDEVLGWSWLIPPYRWSFQGRADEDTELLEFDGAAIRKRCESDTTFGYVILHRFATLMSQRLQAARMKMMEEWNPPGFA